jgi:GPH family glycoside/pentoside/hexuronide:cation symporter
MFVSPDFSATGKLIYAYATYTLMMLAYTAINVPYSALMGVISPSSMERTKVASYRFICAFSAGWVIATFVTPLKNLLGGGSEETGFRLTMMIFAVISILLFWISLRRLRNECIQNRRVPISGPTFAHCSTTAHGSRCFFSGVFALTNVAMRAGATVFYFKYYVGDDGAPIVLIFDKTAVFLSLSTFALVGGVMMTQFLCRRFDKRHLMIALTLGNAVAMSAFYFIPPDQYWLMVAIGSLGTFIVGPTPALVWSMYADCADYGEWKTGRRTTGLIFSGAQFAQKLGLAVGAGLSGYVLFLFGFVSNQAQSAASLAGIRLMFSIFPAVLAVLSAVAIVFYRLSGDKVSQLEHELAERR